MSCLVSTFDVQQLEMLRLPVMQKTLAYFMASISNFGVGHETSEVKYIARRGVLRGHDNRRSYFEDHGGKGALHDR